MSRRLARLLSPLALAATVTVAGSGAAFAEGPPGFAINDPTRCFDLYCDRPCPPGRNCGDVRPPQHPGYPVRPGHPVHPWWPGFRPPVGHPPAAYADPLPAHCAMTYRQGDGRRDGYWAACLSDAGFRNLPGRCRYTTTAGDALYNAQCLRTAGYRY
ncbi:hypothetical protein [Pararhodobacter marinus]|uniref:Uncharacterized protein n=1 Tax=Pararhodobacter marinus TaxID=2184063 RepID=A0A2U2CE15_9RHOB|nr:hypothetical protein [Pararhodobacter marinus]PWE30135.1 hypothetical protein C4N9_05380 [Pararhodobacter marinus]